MEAWVHRDGKIHYHSYEKGIPVGDIEVVGKTDKTGTVIKFYPDDSIFKITTEFDYKRIVDRLRQQAYLTKGIKLNLIDERTDKRYKFYFEG
jgi:DNA gyrase subunit B